MEKTTKAAQKIKQKVKRKAKPVGPEPELNLKAQQIVARYNSRQGPVEALGGLSFELPGPGLYGLLGPNGSGKSTFFKILLGLHKAHSGELSIGHWALPQQLDQIKKNLGVTFQSPALDKWLSVEENLRIHGTLHGLRGQDLENKINLKLKELGLEDRRKTLCKELSGGLARRAELAKTLLSDPQIILLDEPTSGLDPRVRYEFWELLKSLLHNKLVLVATHLMEEAELCDQLVFFHHGQVVAQGTPSELKRQAKKAFIEAEFESAQKREEFIAHSTHQWKLANASSLRLELDHGLEASGELWTELNQTPGLRRLEWGQATLADVFMQLTGEQLK